MSEKLAPGWVLKPVGELASTVQYGYTASAVDRPSGPRLLRITDIQGGRVDWSAVPTCDIEPQDIMKYELEAGDIVFARTGATTGKSYLIGACPIAVFASYLIRLRLVPAAVPSFVHAFFNSTRYWQQIEAGKRGIGQPNVNAAVLSRIEVPLAPLPEQHRIVAEIEKHFTRLDAAVAALERVRTNMKRYRAAVLKAACEGRLVPTEVALARADCRDYEPADQLLARILKERRARWEANQLAKMQAKGKVPKDEKWKAKYEEPSPPNAGDLPTLPDGWLWVSLIQLGFVESGQTPKGVEERATNRGEIPWLKVADMNRSGNERYMTTADRFLSPNDAQSLGMHIRPKGTIIFPKRGGAIATNKKRILTRPSCYDLNTMGIIPIERVAGFLWWWFATVDLSTLGDGSNVPQINHGDIEPLTVSLPPLPEQHRIVAEVERRLSVIDELDAVVDANLKRAERLRQAILKRAFEGKLVPQDPNDEPASVLLERIRAERAANTPTSVNHRGRRRASSSLSSQERAGVR